MMARDKDGDSLVHMISWLYDLFVIMFSFLTGCFFREVQPRGAWNVPSKGPIILVAAPHANQFVDSMILMLVARRELGRRIAFLIAAKSYRRKLVGLFARATGALPVNRTMDNLKSQNGVLYLPDPVNQPTLVRGVGTNFEAFEVGGTIALPTINGISHSADIAEIHSPEELAIKRPFAHKDPLYQLTGRPDINEDGQFTGDLTGFDPASFSGIKFKYAPHVDQTQVYNAVFKTLEEDGCIGIFPEGGSHDRPNLLPLKAGVALMALGAMAKNPECGVKIIPVGMNYFHAHKFRSRAVIEFGSPIDVTPELVQLYRDGKRREAVGQLLDTIYQALLAVTVTGPDFDTLMVIQAARRLYQSSGKKMPLPLVIELNRRLIQGYEHFKDDPRIIKLRKQVMGYNKQLSLLGLRDHQVQYAHFSIFHVVATLLYRLAKLTVLTVGTLPGLGLFAPVFIATKVISTIKSREALAASTVKIRGRDVMATWKLIVALAFAPLLYAFYSVTFTYWTYRNHVQGIVPEWVPLWFIASLGIWLFPSITYAALRFGEVGMDILKSLPPLVLSLSPTGANTLAKLRRRRAELSEQITELINTLGPKYYPDFQPLAMNSGSSSPLLLEGYKSSPSASQLPRNESFPDLGKFGFFSTRPPSRSRSRSNSRPPSSSAMVAGNAGYGQILRPLSNISGPNEGAQEVSKRIRETMRERRRQRQKSPNDFTDEESSADDDALR